MAEQAPMPNPTEEQQRSPEFRAIWQTIKSWDVNVPEFYDGYCGANGSHVALILAAINGRMTKLETAIRAALDELGIPDDDYPAPVGNAHDILTAALSVPDTKKPDG